MMNILLYCFLFFISFNLLGQEKRNLNAVDLGSWPEIGTSACVSNDGRFVSYNIYDGNNKNGTLYIKEVSTGWQMFVKSGKKLNFTENARDAIYIAGNDSLCILNLLTKSIKIIPGVGSYYLLKGKVQQLVYTSKKQSTVVVLNFVNDRQFFFRQVLDLKMNPNGESFVMVICDTTSSLNKKLIWFDKGSKEIWNGSKISSITFSNDGNHLVFAGNSVGKEIDSIKFWNYFIVWSWVRPVFMNGDQKAEIQRRIKYLTDLRISINRERLLFTVVDTIFPKSKSNVTIWRSSDLIFPSTGTPRNMFKESIYSIKFLDGEIRRIVEPEDKLVSITKDDNRQNSSFVVVQQSLGYPTEAIWRDEGRISYFLINQESGKRRLILGQSRRSISFITLSPDDKWLVFYDPNNGNYYSYNTNDGSIHDLTRNINTQWGSYHAEDYVYPSSFPVQTCLWYGEKLIINDRYNLWLIDPKGKEESECLTSIMNPKGNIVFSPAIKSQGDIPLKESNLIVTGFSRETKNHSFYRLDLGRKHGMIMLYDKPVLFGNEYTPYKAVTLSSSSNKRFYLIKRQTATDFPNLYLTEDFKNFNQITNLKPEANIDWLTAELHEWTDFNGKKTQGILYKPDNFDSTKKYPVIVYFYEKLSDQLHQYQFPKHSSGAINIPYMVANGYFVFTPDIYFKTGETGMSFLNGILLATNYLSQLNYIDSTKIGLNGHSFGGYGVNYVISHTTRFGAAVSGSGANDLISHYLWYSGEGQTFTGVMEFSQNRLGISLWEDPAIYIANSPIFGANKISTPLLILANQADKAVPYNQGLGLFLALRRLQKKCWMIEYRSEAHQIANLENQLDYEQKCLDFYNHFLKGQQLSEWMSN